MGISIVIALVTVVLGVCIHLFNLAVLAETLIKRVEKSWAKTQTIVVIAILSQISVAALFSGSYLLAIDLGLGEFSKPATLVEVFYSSLTTITTLGIGVMEPESHLRLIAGIESATGFLLISCSASKMFKTM